MLFVLAVILFIGLVLIHEWGHYIVARRNGVEAEEFGLGLPPRAISKRLKSGMLLSINWLPLGGFVKLKGEHDNDTEPGNFGAASLWAKTKILLAGVTMNLLAGLVLLTIVALAGMPVLLTKANTGMEQFSVASDTRIIRQQVTAGFVLPDSPAKKLGLSGTDIIEKIGTKDIRTTGELQQATREYAGQNVPIIYKHNGQVLKKDVKLLSKAEVEASRNSDNPKGHLGIQPNQLTIQRSTWSAPIVAAGFTEQLAELTIQGLGRALAGLGSAIAGGLSGNSEARQSGQTRATEQVGGPVAIMKILWGSGSLGLNFVLLFIAIISLTLALMNLLPIPALDGGRLAMILISRGVLGRPLSHKAEERIVGFGMIIVLILIVLITIVDVKRFF